MDLRPSDEQQQLVAAFAALYSDLSTPLKVQEYEPQGGHSPELWAALGATGALEMAVPEARGGWGASLLDLALVAEQHGRAVGPAPLLETQVAARLLARLPGTDDLLAHVLGGEKMVTLALRPAVGGTLTLVPAATLADFALAMVGEDLVAVPLVGAVTAIENQGSMPLGDVTVAGVAVLATGVEASAAYALALDEWRVLTAAALAGISQRSLEIGVAYAKERQAFGQPIGSFQGVSHRLADRSTEVDGAILLAREAAWAFDEDPARATLLASMALGFCAETARDTTYFALHFHGGYGFMLEYAIQLYFRRARAWVSILEGPRKAFGRVGSLQLASSAGA